MWHKSVFFGEKNSKKNTARTKKSIVCAVYPFKLFFLFYTHLHLQGNDVIFRHFATRYLHVGVSSVTAHPVIRKGGKPAPQIEIFYFRDAILDDDDDDDCFGDGYRKK